MATEDGGESRRVTDEQAADVFRRAARLQSVVAQRLEERVRDAPSALTPAPRELGPDDLEAIGREVGIDPAFIRMALAETAALLVLRKKVNALWGDGDDDTDERNGS